MSELVGEIAAASSEQAHGIDQITKAVTEMDKVTQQNAASAEESASASEEMNAQADEIKAMVQELIAIVGRSKSGSRRDVRARFMAGKVSPRSLEGPVRLARALGVGQEKGVAVAPRREVRPNQVISLSEEELKAS